jgi:hypothetical protein
VFVAGTTATHFSGSWASLRQISWLEPGRNLRGHRAFSEEFSFAESFVMIRLSVAVALLLTNAPLAFAQHSGTSQEQNACSRDASRFCRKDLGNDGAVQTCLQQNRSRLSASCRKVFESHGM